MLNNHLHCNTRVTAKNIYHFHASGVRAHLGIFVISKVAYRL